MPSRRKTVLAVGTIIVMALFLVLARTTRIALSEVNARSIFEHIRLGESPDHVEMLFGVPPGDYRTSPDVHYVYGEEEFDLRLKHPAWRKLVRRFDQGRVFVLLGDDCTISCKGFNPAGSLPPEPFLGRAWSAICRIFSF